MPELARGARGEGVLEVDGERVEVLFTNRALMEAEQATGKTVLELARAAASEKLGIGDVAKLLAVGMENARRAQARRDGKPGGRTKNVNDALDIMDKLGFATVTACVMEGLSAVLSWAPDEEEGDGENPPS